MDILEKSNEVYITYRNALESTSSTVIKKKTKQNKIIVCGLQYARFLELQSHIVIINYCVARMGVASLPCYLASC